MFPIQCVTPKSLEKQLQSPFNTTPIPPEEEEENVEFPPQVPEGEGKLLFTMVYVVISIDVI